MLKIFASGLLFQDGTWKAGNARWGDGVFVSVEVNMDSNPRTCHFFHFDNQQKLFFENIPESIKFCV